MSVLVPPYICHCWNSVSCECQNEMGEVTPLPLIPLIIAIATMSGRMIRIETRLCVQRRGDTCCSAACRHQQPTQITPAAAATEASNFDTLCTVVIILIWGP